MRLEFNGEVVVGDKEEVVEGWSNKYYMGCITVTGTEIRAATLHPGAFVRAIEAETGEFRRAYYGQMQGL